MNTIVSVSNSYSLLAVEEDGSWALEWDGGERSKGRAEAGAKEAEGEGGSAFGRRKT